MDVKSSLIVLAGIVAALITIFKGYNSLMREIKETKETVGEDYLRTKDLKEITKHKADILGIPDILEKLDRQDKKFDHDLALLTAHEETLAKHTQAIAEEQAHDKRQDMEMRMILKALLAVLRSLEQKGINHTTTSSIHEIEDYIWQTEKN